MRCRIAVLLLAVACSASSEDSPEPGGVVISGEAGTTGSGAAASGGSSGRDATAGDGVPTAGDGGTNGSGPCSPELASVQALIFGPRCASAGCHAGTAPAAALDLEAAAAEANLIGVDAALCDGWTRVVPGDPQRSLLYQKILGAQPPECGEAMPIGSELAPDERACVADWIAALDPTQVPPPAPDPNCETCGQAECVDTASDAQHCGGCGQACPSNASCEQGRCLCPGGQVSCDGACTATCDCAGEICDAACVDTSTNVDHCGGCGTRCDPGQHCNAGACACAAAGVSFADDVLPILVGRCTQGGCHGAMAAKEGLSLTAAAAYSALVGVSAAQCSDGRKRVDPGNAAGSYLVDKLLGVDLCAGTRMPKGSGLPAAEIETISAWICGGAPDD